MHGPGLPPQYGPQPSSGGVVGLRVLFTLLPILSCGFLAWGSMLRLALVTRKTRDWVLMVATCVLSVFWFVLFGLDPTSDTTGWQSDTGGFGTLITGLAACVYFLVSDIKHHEAVRTGMPAGQWYPSQPAPYAHPQQSAPSYGYPPAQAPTVHSTPTPSPSPAPAPPQVPPQTTPPPRIGQVRAELDELSELLRKQTPPPGGPRQDPHQTAFQDPNQ
ncbi:hypothetical protein [Streptomyces sp. NPDC059979]|uniref:hypothetical protein n=1 Tax=Streptomyces sp. NPDC059979 TaxID=3347021 RepID=UPI0036758F92